MRAHRCRTVGNFWVDITRCTLYILLPICIVYALFLVWQGIPQTLGPYVEATTLEGAKQTIAVGPVASQIAIKMLGTNGGGFFNANAAHPFENPTALSNFVQMISIFAIGAALTNVFGRMVGNQRQGWAILAVMGVLFIAGVVVCYWAEAHGNDASTRSGLTGGNMEGKEVRFGIVASALFAVITTAASCGAVNAMHDSFTALGGMIPLINIQLGEIIVGGVGAGLYGMLLFVILAIFVAGLMVGRTPEYVGKKIEAKEVKMAMLAILVLPLMYLGWTAVAAVLPVGGRRHGQSRPARLHRGALCLHLADRQQRLGLRGPHRQHAVLQHHRRRRDVRRPLLDDHPGDGDRRLAGGQEVGSGVGRHVPDHRRPVRRPRRRRDRDRRRPHLLPGARARTHRRAPRDDRRHRCSHRIDLGATSMETSNIRKRMPVSALFDPKIVVPAIGSAFVKLDPRTLIKNPVMFVLEIVTALTTVILVRDLVDRRRAHRLRVPDHPLAVVHGAVRQLRRGHRRRPRQGAGRFAAAHPHRDPGQAAHRTTTAATFKLVPGTSLKVGDVVLVEAGDIIPSDGEVVEGIASVNEAAITGESAPVIRESGGDRSAVTGGTQVLSDWIRVRITAAPGSTFLDRMIRLVEGAERQKTPNEIALNILLVGLTIIFVFATATIPSYVAYAGGAVSVVDPGRAVRDPDPDHDRRAAVGHRHRRHGPAGALQRARHVRAARSKRPATSTRCCSTRPAPSRSATARRPSSSRCAA